MEHFPNSSIRSLLLVPLSIDLYNIISFKINGMYMKNVKICTLKCNKYTNRKIKIKSLCL